jgi:chromosome segregation ATPase
MADVVSTDAPTVVSDTETVVSHVETPEVESASTTEDVSTEEEAAPVEETQEVTVESLQATVAELTEKLANLTRQSRKHEDRARAADKSLRELEEERETYKGYKALEEEREQFIKERSDFTKSRLAAQYELPESALKFVTATDAAEMEEQIKGLSELKGGAPASPLIIDRLQGSDSTESAAPLTPEQEIIRALKRQRAQGN